MMRAAVFAPMPGSASSWLADALLMLTALVTAGLAPARGPAFRCAAPATLGFIVASTAMARNGTNMRIILLSFCCGPWPVTPVRREVKPPRGNRLPDQGRPGTGAIDTPRRVVERVAGSG